MAEICWPAYFKALPFLLGFRLSRWLYGLIYESLKHLLSCPLSTVRAEENGVDNNQGDRPSDRGKRGRGRGEMVALVWDWHWFYVLKWNFPIYFFQHFILSICWLSFHSISTSATFNLGTSPSLTPSHVLVSEQLKRIDINHHHGRRLVCSGYGELFPQIDSCQPPVSGSALVSGCTLAAGEYKIPSVGLSGRDLMCTCAVSLGWIWLSGLPSVFGSQSQKEQPTLETFW